MTELIKYDAACRMLAEAVAVDEVQDIRGKAEMMRAYARQAKDRALEISAAQIRFRAERRLGELIIAQKETVGLAQGRRTDLVPAGDEVSDGKVSLEQAGIDRKLSSRAQRMADIPTERFEQLLSLHREEVLEGNNKVSVDLMRTSAEAEGREKRRNLAQALSDATADLPIGRMFPCAYLDPPWHRKQGVTDRSYENHYPTMTWDEIIALCERVAKILLPDNWVFLWIPRAHLLALHPVDMEFADDDGRVITRKVKMPLSWAVARALGCDNYSTCYIWTKTDEEHPNDQGGGVLVFDQDEILLQFKRGRGLPKPATDEKFKSNHRERKREHSRKPDHYRDMIRTMTGGVPVLELFARVDAEHPLPPDWEAWGNQAVVAVEIAAAEIDASAAFVAPIAENACAAAVSEIAAAPEIAAPIEPLPQLCEFDELRAFSDFCFPRRMEILTAIAPAYIERGLAYSIKIGGSDWGLTEAGWKRFYAIEKERRALAPALDQEIVDGALQCRLPLSDHEIEMQRALHSIDAGELVDSEIASHLESEGFVRVTTTRLVVADEGRAWLAGLVDLPIAELPALDLPLFLAARA
jgi:N6-adenosine-specific RNA methylase IME4